MRPVLPIVFLASLTAPAFAHEVARPVAAAGDPRAVEQAFLDAAARSLGPRSGDLFTLPHAYNSLVEPAWAIPEVSRIPGRGLVRHKGAWHSGMWKYDSRIPMILYGPGLVRPGARPGTAATQQDWPATMAWAMRTTPPRDCGGRALTEGFMARPARPKAILTIVLDQGGRGLYAAHPGVAREIASLQARGADWPRCEVTHLEAETALGHVALGTGAWPDRTGIPSNYFFHGGAGKSVYGFTVEARQAPQFLEAPTLGDAWLRASKGEAIVVSLSQSDRAAMGMAGHGSYYQGNPKPIVTWFDSVNGRFTTNDKYFQLPDYARELHVTPYRAAVEAPAGRWLGHAIPDHETAKYTPALPALEGDLVARLLDREPIGQDDVTDLVYVSFKSTDYAGHQYGSESQEARDVLAAVDAQVGRLVRRFEQKVGRGNFLVAITADHGATPLPELSGGLRYHDTDLLAGINRRFGKGAAPYATTGQIWLDRAVLAAGGHRPAAVAAHVRAIRVQGKPFYRLVVDREAVARRRLAMGLAGR